jgi:hypothetical protein
MPGIAVMVSRRVLGEPLLALGEQLVDLPALDPVVLVVVHHRQQHVEMPEEVARRTTPRSVSPRYRLSPQSGRPHPA